VSRGPFSLRWRLVHEDFAFMGFRVDMNAKKQELATIALVAAICAVASWASGHEFFTPVFVLESAVAAVMTFL
jgi:hypothetical protein